MVLSHLVQSRSAIGKEMHMALDKIIVFVMAIAFFGGLMYLALKGRRGTSRESQPFSSRTQGAAEPDALPIQPQEKERWKSKK